MSNLGILQNYRGESTIFIYHSEEDREDAWNSLTEHGRKKYGWKKVEVEVKLEEGDQ